MQLLNGKKYVGQVQAVDSARDLALLKINDVSSTASISAVICTSNTASVSAVVCVRLPLFLEQFKNGYKIS